MNGKRIVKLILIASTLIATVFINSRKSQAHQVWTLEEHVWEPTEERGLKTPVEKNFDLGITLFNEYGEVRKGHQCPFTVHGGTDFPNSYLFYGIGVEVGFGSSHHSLLRDFFFNESTFRVKAGKFGSICQIETESKCPVTKLSSHDVSSSKGMGIKGEMEKQVYRWSGENYENGVIVKASYLLGEGVISGIYPASSVISAHNLRYKQLKLESGIRCALKKRVYSYVGCYTTYTKWKLCGNRGMCGKEYIKYRDHFGTVLGFKYIFSRRINGTCEINIGKIASTNFSLNYILL